MYVQTAITIFNKRLGADRREVYFPTCIRSASFLENKSSGHSTDGAHSQSLAYKLRIPLGAKIQDGRSYVPADKFRQLDEDAAAKAWTLRPGDRIEYKGQTLTLLAVHDNRGLRRCPHWYAEAH